MKSYFYYGYLAFKTQLMYKSNILFSIIKAFLFFFVQVNLWKGLYAGLGEGRLTYSLNEMLTYQVLSAIIGTFLSETVPMSILQKDINTGNIMNYLKLPNSYTGQVFMSSLGKNLFSFFSVSIPLVVVSCLYVPVMFPSSTRMCLVAAGALLFSILVYFEIFYLFGMVSFWFLDRYGTMGLLLTNVMRILSGALIPLALFPNGLRKVVLMLPLRYGFDFPISIYLGKISEKEILSGFLLQALWVVILWFINHKVFKTGLRKLVLQGG